MLYQNKFFKKIKEFILCTAYLYYDTRYTLKQQQF